MREATAAYCGDLVLRLYLSRPIRPPPAGKQRENVSVSPLHGASHAGGGIACLSPANEIDRILDGFFLREFGLSNALPLASFIVTDVAAAFAATSISSGEQQPLAAAAWAVFMSRTEEFRVLPLHW